MSLFSGWAKELEDSVGNVEESNGVKQARDIQEMANSISEQVQEVMTLAKEGRQHVDLDTVMSAAIDKIRPPENIKRQINIARSLPMVCGGAPQLVQIFVNLIDNAVAAMQPKRRGTLRIKAHSQRAHEKHWVIVQIEDTGIGIEKSILSDLGRRWHTTKPKGTGLGLGFWLSQTYVERIGGQLSVSSVLGKGTTIRVTLPAAD
jgi:two-component system NtrC family sensor kinase